MEIAIALPMHVSQAELPKEIANYVYDGEVLADGKDANWIALGYGSLYNHDNPANLRYETDLAEHVITFIAVRDIGQFEELTINYNALDGGHIWHNNHWFERLKVEPILKKCD